MSAQTKRSPQESLHEETVAPVVQVVQPVPTPPVQPLNDRAQASSSGKIAFLRHVLVGFAKVYAEGAQTLLRPVLFLWAHLGVFMRAVAHLGVPVILALGLSTLGPVASLFAEQPLYAKAFYLASFWLAGAFVWVSFCLFCASLWANLFQGMKKLEQVGKTQ